MQKLQCYILSKLKIRNKFPFEEQGVGDCALPAKIQRKNQYDSQIKTRKFPAGHADRPTKFNELREYNYFFGRQRIQYSVQRTTSLNIH